MIIKTYKIDPKELIAPSEFDVSKIKPIKIDWSVFPQLHGYNVVWAITDCLGLKWFRDQYADNVAAYGLNSIHISNHRTNMQEWIDNGTWDSPYRISIVIEDSPTTASTEVKDGFDFTVDEYVFNANIFNSRAVLEAITYDVINVEERGVFPNTLKGEYVKLVTTHENYSTTLPD